MNLQKETRFEPENTRNPELRDGLKLFEFGQMV